MILHLRDLDAAASGGVLYVTVGDIAFPEEGWYDLAAADLENWLPGLCSFARGHTDSCLLQFMDGPAAVRLTRAAGRICAVCLWAGRLRIPETQIDLRAFLESTIRCLRFYDRTLYQQGSPARFARPVSELKSILTTISL